MRDFYKRFVTTKAPTHDDQSEPRTTVPGSGNFRYDVILDWEQLPQDWSFYEAVGVATDSQDRVYVFNRNGNLQARWGGGDNPCEPATSSPHTISGLIRGEASMSAGGIGGLVPADCPSLQKFVRTA